MFLQKVRWFLWPRSFHFKSPTFDTKSWGPRAFGSQSPTFGTESWRLKTQCFGSSTFDVESWMPLELSLTFHATFACPSFFFYLFNVNWIHPQCFLHSFGVILLVNACVFQVFFENKVDLVLVDVPSNLLISHILEPPLFIPQWTKCVDNFIEYVVVFVDKYLFDRGVVIIMHIDDPRVLKKIRSFLESY